MLIVSFNQDAARPKLFAEISVITAMFDEIFSQDVLDKLTGTDKNATIGLLLRCAKDHIMAQYLCHQEVQDSATSWDFAKMKPGAEFQRLAVSFCTQVQSAVDKYIAEVPCPVTGHAEWASLVWKTFVFSNFIELYFFGKIGLDNTDVEAYINAALRPIARDLLSTVKSVVSPAGQLSRDWQCWADGYRPKLILYPLTQRLWDAIPRGVEHTSDVPPGYFASAPSAPMYASPC